MGQSSVLPFQPEKEWEGRWEGGRYWPRQTHTVRSRKVDICVVSLQCYFCILELAGISTNLQSLLLIDIFQNMMVFV